MAAFALSARPALAGKRVTAARKTTVAARPNRMIVRADYMGSPTNLVMVANIAATLAMGRFKFSPLGVLVPSTKKEAYAAASAVPESGAWTDPEGFTAAKVLAFASLGHAHGIGMVLGLKAMGML